MTKIVKKIEVSTLPPKKGSMTIDPTTGEMKSLINGKKIAVGGTPSSEDEDEYGPLTDKLYCEKAAEIANLSSSFKCTPKDILGMVMASLHSFAYPYEAIRILDPGYSLYSVSYSNASYIKYLPTIKCTISGPLVNSLIPSGIVAAPKINLKSTSTLEGLFSSKSDLKWVYPINAPRATSANSMFANCVELEEVEFIDLHSLTNASQMFLGCAKLKRVEGLDFSKLTSAAYMFLNCSSYEGPIDLKGLKFTTTGFGSMFNGCSVPELRNVDYSLLASVSSANDPLYGASNIHRILGLKTANAMNTAIGASGMTLKEILDLEIIDNPSGTNSYNGMFAALAYLEKIIVKSMVEGSYSMFCSSNKLREVEGFDYSKVKNTTSPIFPNNLIEELGDITSTETMTQWFLSSSKLRKIGNISTTLIITTTFASCSNLEEIGDIKSKGFSNAFAGDYKIKKIGIIDCSDFVKSYMYNGWETFLCGISTLEELGGLKDLGKSYTSAQVTAANQYGSVDLSAALRLTKNSVDNIIKSVYDISDKIASLGGRQKVKLHPSVYSILTIKQKQDMIKKGWEFVK